MSRARDRADGDYKTDSSVIDFGADGDVTLTHDPDDGLILKSKATADDNPVLLTLQTGETDLAANDVIGKIAFQAPDEGTGTDAILVSAAIQAVAEGDHSSSSNASSLVFMTGASEAAAEKMRIKSNGEVQVGLNTTVADCGATLAMTGANGSNAAQTFSIYNDGENGQTKFRRNIGGGSVITDAIVSYHNYWKFTMDGNHVAATGQYYEFYQTAATWTMVMENAHASNPWGFYFNYHDDPDNDTNYFFAGDDGDGTTARIRIDSDGDVKNHDNSYGAISDERIKEDIKDANSQWDDIKAVKIRNFKKKDDVRQYGDKAWEQIGVIAQELEAVSPKLIKGAEPTKGDIISSSDFGTLVDDTTKPDTYYEEGDTIPDGKQVGDAKTYKKKVEIKEKVKAVKYSILYMKAIKALQEAMTRIETLEAKVKALEDG